MVVVGSTGAGVGEPHVACGICERAACGAARVQPDDCWLITWRAIHGAVSKYILQWHAGFLVQLHVRCGLLAQAKGAEAMRAQLRVRPRDSTPRMLLILLLLHICPE